jgi:hypothetical protein
MRDIFTVYDISNKVLKWGLSLYEWGAVVFACVFSIAIFHKGLEIVYDLLFAAAVVFSLKFYKIGKPDGYVKSLMDFYLSEKQYHVRYRPETK